MYVNLKNAHRVPQQINTIICVIHSRKPQSLYTNKEHLELVTTLG